MVASMVVKTDVMKVSMMVEMLVDLKDIMSVVLKAVTMVEMLADLMVETMV